VLGSFLIGSCIVFMTFVVLNLLISVILVAFSEEQKYDQVSSFGLFIMSLTLSDVRFRGT
jgi:polycystin 1L2